MAIASGKVILLNISGNECKFTVETKDDGEITVSVPDMGGQMDINPKELNQVSWLEACMAGIADAERIRETIWRLKSVEAKDAIERILLAERGSKVAYTW